MDRFIDDVMAAFLTALQGSGQRFGTITLGILSFVAIVTYYREFGARILQGQGSLRGYPEIGLGKTSDLLDS